MQMQMQMQETQSRDFRSRRPVDPRGIYKAQLHGRQGGIGSERARCSLGREKRRAEELENQRIPRAWRLWGRGTSVSSTDIIYIDIHMDIHIIINYMDRINYKMVGLRNSTICQLNNFKLEVLLPTFSKLLPSDVFDPSRVVLLL